MKVIVIKKPALIGIIAGICLLAVLGGLMLFLPKKPDPAELLAKATEPFLQSLCLQALTAEEPENPAHWQGLLDRYQQQGADPLTLYARQKEAEAKTGQTLVPQGERGTFTPAPPKERFETAKPPKGFYCGVRADEELAFYAGWEGITADYKGLRISLSPAVADRLIPAENGLYYLNTTQRRVQFISADGGVTRTLSSVDAKDFTYWGGDLFILTPQGALFHNETEVALPAPGECLQQTNGTLTVLTEEGPLQLQQQ